MGKRLSEAEKQTIWDMREQGVPVKRIARHLGRQNVSLRVFIADSGGMRPRPQERSELRCAWRSERRSPEVLLRACPSVRLPLDLSVRPRRFAER